jgi:hypothetical protein
MSTIDTLAKRLDTIHNDGGEFTLEDFVLSKPLIQPGETHSQCMTRLSPSRQTRYLYPNDGPVDRQPALKLRSPLRWKRTKPGCWPGIRLGPLSPTKGR